MIEADIQSVRNQISLLTAQLKEMEAYARDGKHLNFSKFRNNPIDGVRFGHGIDDVSKALRDLVTAMASVRISETVDKEKFLNSGLKKLKVSELGDRRVRLCNQFLDAVHPIFCEYVREFVKINEETDGFEGGQP